MAGVAPVGDGVAEVAEGALGDTVGDFGDEGEVFTLDGVELFGDVLP